MEELNIEEEKELNHKLAPIKVAKEMKQKASQKV